jgi:hypothetical protein
MKKIALLISLIAFVFVSTTTFGQTTSDDSKKETKKTTITTSKVKTDAKAPCEKKTRSAAHKCAHKKPGHKCSHSKKAPCPKTAAKKEDAVRNDEVIEEKEKEKNK